MSSLIGKVLSRIRTQPEGGESVSSRTLVGWYVRKGLMPAIRGSWFLLRVKGRFPIFVGSGCSVAYGRSIRAGRFVVLGRNSVVNAFSTGGIQLGDRVTIRENAWIQCSSHPSSPGAGLAVGARTYIGPSAIIGVGGQITIGADCQIGSGLTLIAENHAVDEDGQPSASEVTRLGITIGNGCWIGHRAAILDGVILGDNCVVGAGAVVTKSFPAGSTIVGVPGRVVANRD